MTGAFDSVPELLPCAAPGKTVAILVAAVRDASKQYRNNSDACQDAVSRGTLRLTVWA
ncbi:MAG: hypothetical protein LBS91_05890 [Clostridiales Family XIII bacterium]|jgi:hypothetical protein|nr:hypothetical protein [Clostridiales Family XIII bacterium]